MRDAKSSELQDPALLEAHEAAPLADDQVVEGLDSEERSSRDEATGEGDVSEDVSGSPLGWVSARLPKARAPLASPSGFLP